MIYISLYPLEQSCVRHIVGIQKIVESDSSSIHWADNLQDVPALRSLFWRAVLYTLILESQGM